MSVKIWVLGKHEFSCYVYFIVRPGAPYTGFRRRKWKLRGDRICCIAFVNHSMLPYASVWSICICAQRRLKTVKKISMKRNDSPIYNIALYPPHMHENYEHAERYMRRKIRSGIIEIHANDRNSSDWLRTHSRKHNSPRSDALPFERTAARTAVITGVYIYLPCQKNKTRSDSSGIWTRNPDVVQQMRYQLNHTRSTIHAGWFKDCMCWQPRKNRLLTLKVCPHLFHISKLRMRVWDKIRASIVRVLEIALNNNKNSHAPSYSRIWMFT